MHLAIPTRRVEVTVWLAFERGDQALLEKADLDPYRTPAMDPEPTCASRLRDRISQRWSVASEATT